MAVICNLSPAVPPLGPLLDESWDLSFIDQVQGNLISRTAKRCSTLGKDDDFIFHQGERDQESRANVAGSQLMDNDKIFS